MVLSFHAEFRLHPFCWANILYEALELTYAQIVKNMNANVAYKELQL